MPHTSIDMSYKNCLYDLGTLKKQVSSAVIDACQIEHVYTPVLDGILITD